MTFSKIFEGIRYEAVPYEGVLLEATEFPEKMFCMKGTREGAIKYLQSWIQEQEQKIDPVYWDRTTEFSGLAIKVMYRNEHQTVWCRAEPYDPEEEKS